jgi:hypothetical protein
MDSIIIALASAHPIVAMILAVLGMLVVLGLAVVAITPSQEDDAFVAKMLAIPVLGQVILALQNFSPIQKRPKE